MRPVRVVAAPPVAADHAKAKATAAANGHCVHLRLRLRPRMGSPLGDTCRGPSAIRLRLGLYVSIGGGGLCRRSLNYAGSASNPTRGPTGQTGFPPWSERE